MKNKKICKKTVLLQSMKLILENGNRLLEDVEYTPYYRPPATAYFLIMIAQEEFAKAFLIDLVRRDIIPWSPHIFRASRDHTCKQLLKLIMEYLSPDVEEFQKRGDAVVLYKQEPTFPSHVADAINILRYEKIKRWESKNWVWADQIKYDDVANKVAQGKTDKKKQNSLYVQLGRNGEVVNTPKWVTEKLVKQEFECARRLRHLVENLLSDEKFPALYYDLIENAFRTVFQTKNIRTSSS